MATAKRLSCTNFLAYDKKIIAHESVIGCQHRLNIAIELPGQQHNGHTNEAGHEETSKLRNAHMLPQQLPNQIL